MQPKFGSDYLNLSISKRKTILFSDEWKFNIIEEVTKYGAKITVLHVEDEGNSVIVFLCRCCGPSIPNGWNNEPSCVER